MNKPIIVLLLLLVNIFCFAQEVTIKSLQTYTGKDQINFPLISINGNSKINIEFDIESEENPSLSIHFYFCDKNWEPYLDNLFLNNPLKNIDENIWLDQIPGSEFSANYHFKGSYPTENIEFNLSGKWIYFIADAYDEEMIYASGKFLVVNNLTPLEVDLQRVTINRAQKNQNNAYNRSFQIITDFVLPDTLDPFKVDRVEIIENQKLDYPIIIDKEISQFRTYEWDASHKFKFIVQDISPGNNYRQTNLMNTDRHYPPSTTAHLNGPETSNFYYLNSRDYFGGNRIVKFTNDESRYMTVDFELRLDSKITKSVFLVGSFNNWQVWPEYEMNFNDGLYDISIELKRGIYDYQYVLADRYDDYLENIDWLTLEGNEYDANRQYYILLYYNNELLGGYDEIIGFRKIKSSNF